MKKLSLLILISLSTILFASAQGRVDNVARERFKNVSVEIDNYMYDKADLAGKIFVRRADVKNDTLNIAFCSTLAEYPVRDIDIERIYKVVKKSMPAKYSDYSNKFIITVNNVPLEKLSSGYYSKKERSDGVKSNAFKAEKYPLVRRVSNPSNPSNGLSGRHIAVWQSHGYYYEQSLKRWEWQRARIFETVEDLYTQSYVLPFLVPMLENAGANVILPRERDVQSIEIIVDNDESQFNGGNYYETNGLLSWGPTHWTGFANKKATYLYKENPFSMGTARVAKCVTEESGDSLSIAHWIAKVPESGEYAVYVSYGTLKGSTKSAHYTVHHNGGSTEFLVNQQMGGGTWIYLGTFGFMKESETQGVYLDNRGDTKYEYVTADGVKFGGGMGNIARNPSEVDEKGNKVEMDFAAFPEVSGYPRFTEGSRYWLQWAGMCDTIYSNNRNLNDYNDDYQSRGRWVNAMTGGSSRLPDNPGYKVPVDLSFAFHTDAGTTLNDSIIGTLAIYTRVSNDEEKYIYKGDRIIARELTDIVQTQIVDDIRAFYEPEWNRRGLWDKTYAESRSPEVPSMLLELLSHQNFADMRYGLDPSFRFTVSRAIYKGMLRYLSYVNDTKYVVQPLPVNSFSTQFYKEDEGCDENHNVVYLYWKGSEDPLESTASPDGYIVYQRITELDSVGNTKNIPGSNLDGFDNGTYSNKDGYRVEIEPGKIYSFKVTAVNKGGESFPSEILSVGAPIIPSSETVMIVNAFDRISAPSSFATRDSSRAGFVNYIDGGVPYLRDISYIGAMHEFRREIPWMDDDAPGFGASYADCETMVIAGNTFDYPLIHGAAMLRAGYNFVSSSKKSVCDGYTDLKLYPIVDIITGKEIRTMIGRKKFGDNASPSDTSCRTSALLYEVFPAQLRRSITAYCHQGGNLIVSGANIASDLWDKIYDFQLDSSFIKSTILPEQEFAQNILKYKWMTNYASATGKVKSVQNPFAFPIVRYSFYTEPNPERYCVETPDGLVPADKTSFTVFRYADNNISAGVAYCGDDYKCVSLGFPIEALKDQDQIDNIIGNILKLFAKGSTDIKQVNPTLGNIKSSESKY